MKMAQLCWEFPSGILVLIFDDEFFKLYNYCVSCGFDFYNMYCQGKYFMIFGSEMQLCAARRICSDLGILAYYYHLT